MPLKALKKIPKKLRGDTIVEVTFAVAMFSVVAVVSINIMNSGLSSAQASLEVTMARNEIDAQAEALRFIHDSYVTQRKLDKKDRQYEVLWKDNIVDLYVNAPADIADFATLSCPDLYDQNKPNNIFEDKAFVLNTRLLVPANVNSKIIQSFFQESGDTTSLSYAKLTDEIIISTATAGSRFTTTDVFPRLVYSTPSGITTDQLDEGDTYSRDYRRVAKAEGIWIIAVRDGMSGAVPTFYDFHIRTCWYPPGRSTPSTIATVVRLYNPSLGGGT